MLPGMSQIYRYNNCLYYQVSYLRNWGTLGLEALLTTPEPKRLTLEPWRLVLELSGTNRVRFMAGL